MTEAGQDKITKLHIKRISESKVVKVLFIFSAPIREAFLMHKTEIGVVH